MPNNFISNLRNINVPYIPNLADGFHYRLLEWINDFHRGLDQSKEVGAAISNFGQSITIHIRDIGYWNPSLIKFYGKTETGESVELIQHVSQINVLLIAMDRKNIESPKRPIGFASWEEYDKAKEENE